MASTLLVMPHPPLPPAERHPPSPPPSPAPPAQGESDLSTPVGSQMTDTSFETTTSGASESELPEIDGEYERDTTQTSVDAISPPRHAAMSPGKGAQLDDYQLIKVLGKGCAGRVLLVKQTSTSAVLAMKAISKRSVLAHDELDHTMTELNILKLFAIHEPDNLFVAKLHHSFTDRENFYFVMDFYPGGDLATQLEIHGRLGHHRTRFYAVDLVQGMEDLHRHGVIVRDLKPENILLDSKGHAVLADFGLSKEFGYRGEPRPLHVVTYPGQGPLPEWAGKGAASLRTTPSGSKKLVIDRAYSFVGTAEYLSPEVVKRGEYSYATDWWALGCIILEGMIGRVPFRKEDDEPPIVLWNKILNDPWDSLFNERRFVGRSLLDWGLDSVTWDFVDALLIKDPMWRLTEPYIKTHPYFSQIDWDMVKRGDYSDPFDLNLHPVQEYNTHYFPKLCLDEEPTVDMSSHTEEYHHGWNEKRTPLNDNDLYKLEQAKHMRELEAFTWSRDALEEGECDLPPQELSPLLPNPKSTLRKVELDQVDPAPFAWNGYSYEHEQETWLDELHNASDEAQRGSMAATDEIPDLVDEDGKNVIAESAALTDITMPLAASTDPLSAPSKGVFVSEPLSESLDLPPKPTSSPDDGSSGPPTQPPSLIRRSESTPSSPRPIAHHSIKSRKERPTDINLPSGLPSSGLSVSDMVSVGSPGLGSPSRIVRRHKAQPSLDGGPLSRLSVDLHGTITNLGDDDWEELDMSEGMESYPNGRSVSGQTPPNFFSRVMKRRPSTINSSGLKRQVKTSEPSSPETSPIKPSTPTTIHAAQQNLGKKALEKLKAFPKFRKPSMGVRPETERKRKGSHQPPPSAYVSPDRTDEETSPTAARPEAPRRHTESGWFDRRRLLRKQPSNPAIVASVSQQLVPRSISAKMTRSHTEVALTQRAVSSGQTMPPRVELRETPPIQWDLGRKE